MWTGKTLNSKTILSVYRYKPPEENFFGNMRCEPLEAMSDLINNLGRREITLKAGDFVSTGAVTVPLSFSKGSQVTADFGNIGSIELIFG